MKTTITQKIKIPEGINCRFDSGTFKFNNGSYETVRVIDIPQIEVLINDGEITLSCENANKKQYKIIKTIMAHIKNIFSGFNQKFVYELESCNVHFPMTLKKEGSELVINNFLGEKKPRRADILPNVEVEVKGSKIIVSSHSREAAGQTATNFEKATKIRNRDRRIYQDGIYITKKPARKI